jgi:hypothetical protein
MTANVPTPSRPGATHRRHIQVGAALAVLPLVAVLAACGSSNATPATQAPSQAPTQAPNSGAAGGTGTIPGASGLIAAASPGTLQVQSSTAQTTVVYTTATKFTAVTSGHVAAGDCVIVTGAPVAGSTKALTATSARIEAKVKGACPTTGAGGGFGGGGFGGGGSTRRPSGAPSSGSGARRAFASATGTVSSVSGSTILVTGVLRSGLGAAGSTTAPASPSTITVTLGSSATVTQTVSATSAAAVVGQCATAIGPANSVGAITAKSITISAPGPTGCRIGFGGRGNGNGASGNGATGTGTAGSNA